MVLFAVGLAAGGRLEHTYLPPQSASQAGGDNLPLPLGPTLALVSPSNTYLPPSNDIVVDAKLLQGRQQTSFSSQGSLAHFSAQPAAHKFSFGSQQSSFSSQPSLTKINSFSSQSSLAKISPFGSQQSSFSAQPSLPKKSFFGSQQSIFSSQSASPIAAKASSGYGAQQLTSSLSQQAQGSQASTYGAQIDLRQGGFSSSVGQPVAIVRSINENNGDGSYTYR